MKNLLPGLRRFSEDIFPGHQKHFEALAQGQKPHTLMITCSDSRIDPNLLTQTLPGEIFVVRNAGNIVPPFGSTSGGEEAAIEFAINGLGIRNIVICGHSQCGAMAALREESNLDDMPCVKSWLNYAQGTKEKLKLFRGEYTLTNIAEENVLVQSDNLKTHPCVSAGLKAGRLHVYGWCYNFETGSVSIYNPATKKFCPSNEVSEEAEKDVSVFALK